MTDRRSIPAVTFALCALLTACSSDSSVAPTTVPPVTLSQALGEISLPSLASAASLLTSAPVQTLAAPLPSACSYAASSQFFTCPPVTSNGLTITESFELLDTTGNPQTQFDPKATAAVRVKSTVNGTVTQSGTTLTIAQQQDMTLSGLLTGTHVLNGLTTVQLNGTIVSGTTSLPISSSATITTANLVLPPSGSSSNWPVSGTITDDMTTSTGSLPVITTHLTMTFNGTSKVAVVITIGGLSQHCTIDLAAAAPACS